MGDISKVTASPKRGKHVGQCEGVSGKVGVCFKSGWGGVECSKVGARGIVSKVCAFEGRAQMGVRQKCSVGWDRIWFKSA